MATTRRHSNDDYAYLVGEEEDRRHVLVELHDLLRLTEDLVWLQPVELHES